MNNKVKAGSLTLWGLIIFVIGVWGGVGDAQDLVQTLFGLPTAEIYFLLTLAGTLVLSFGIVSLISLNWQNFVEWRKKVNRTKIKKLVVPGFRVVNYLADTAVIKQSITGSKRYSDAASIIDIKIKSGELTCGILQDGLIKPVKADSLTDVKFVIIPSKGYSSSEDKALKSLLMKDKSIFANEAYFDESEIKKLWHGPSGYYLS